MSLKVLVVDDAPAVRLVLRTALRRIGLNESGIFEAAEPTRALEIFQVEHPEVVFLDISLDPRKSKTVVDARGEWSPLPASTPPEEGEVLAKLMFAADPGVKIVVCTGNTHDNRSVREVVKEGAFAVLEKPVTLAKVQRTFQLLAAEGLTISGSGPFRPRLEYIDREMSLHGV